VCGSTSVIKQTGFFFRWPFFSYVWTSHRPPIFPLFCDPKWPVPFLRAQVPPTVLPFPRQPCCLDPTTPDSPPPSVLGGVVGGVGGGWVPCAVNSFTVFCSFMFAFMLSCYTFYNFVGFTPGTTFLKNPVVHTFTLCLPPLVFPPNNALGFVPPLDVLWNSPAGSPLLLPPVLELFFFGATKIFRFPPKRGGTAKCPYLHGVLSFV